MKDRQDEVEVAVVKEVGVTGIVEMGVIGKDTIAAAVVVIVNEGIDRLQVGMIEIMINGTREKGFGVEMIAIPVLHRQLKLRTRLIEIILSKEEEKMLHTLRHP